MSRNKSPNRRSPGNLLATIPKDINIQYILSQFDPETAEKYLATSTTLTKDVKDYKEDQLY